MIRSLGAVIAGYASILFFNAFIRFIISIYAKQGYSLSGTAHLSSTGLILLILAAGLVFGLIGGLITCSIIDDHAAIEILVLILLVLGAALFKYYFTGPTESLWYMVSEPLLKMAGIYGAYYLKTSKGVNK
jgi:hypothetical protein